jgi:hypothetical protein
MRDVPKRGSLLSGVVGLHGVTPSAIRACYPNGGGLAPHFHLFLELHLTLGEEETRQATTVAGSTTIIVRCQFTNAQGKVLLARDIQGKVRFLVGNLKATYEVAKKAARVAHSDRPFD